MTPNIAVNITAKDKTEAGRKSAEKGFNAFARKTSAQSKESGFAKLGKQLDGFSKFKTIDFGFGAAGRSLATIGNVANDVGSGFGNATRAAVGFGASGEGAMAAVAEGAGLAATAVAGTVAAVAGLAVGTYMLGDKWAKAGAEIDRTSRTIGVSAQELQNARAAGERFGVTADATTASIDALGTTLYDARSGANNLALGGLNQLGVKLKLTKDGAVDTQQALLDLADAIARQKDPQVQRKIARIYGVESMLPLLRQGSAAIKAAGADYQSSGAPLTDAEVAKAAATAGKTVTVKQHLGALEKGVGVAAMGGTAMAADAMLAGGKDLASGRPLTSLVEGAKGLAHSGLEAGRHLVEGAEAAGRKIGEEFMAFAHRIEHQESRGHQLDRRGAPLTSNRGAIGAMQMLPETAQRAARRAGIAWDPDRFRKDKAYNEQLGQAELSRLLEKYDGNEVLAAAAYNAGEGRVDGTKKNGYRDGWLARFGDPRKGQISDADFADKIPFRETRDYVDSTAKAHVEITLKGAPAGTVARVTGAPGVEANLNIARGMDGP